MTAEEARCWKAVSGSLEPKTPYRRTSTRIIKLRHDARLDAARRPVLHSRTASDPTGFAVLTSSQAPKGHRSLLVAPLP
jgi:hypothetical protein